MTEKIEEKEATHIAIPIKLMQEMSALIATEIPWGKADQVMSALKTVAVPINIDTKQDK